MRLSLVLLYSGVLVFNQALRPQAAHAVAAVVKPRSRVGRPAVVSLPSSTPMTLNHSPGAAARFPLLQSVLPSVSPAPLTESFLTRETAVRSPSLPEATVTAEAVLRAGALELAETDASPEAARKIYEGKMKESADYSMDAVDGRSSPSGLWSAESWSPAAIAGGLLVAAPSLVKAAENQPSFGWKASLALAGTAALGALYVRMKSPGSSLAKAFAERDSDLTDQLLAAVDVLREAAEGASRGMVESLASSVLVGNYAQAREHLARLAKAPEPLEKSEGVERAMSLLSKRMPVRDLKGADILRGVMMEVLGSVSSDPFQTQALISRLAQGIAPTNMPRPLWDKHLKLSKKSSLQARERAAARRGKKIGDVQFLNDCFVRAFYDLPIAALEPLRRRLSYPEFLARVEKEFPDKEVMEKGLEFSDFKALVERMGYTYKAHNISEYNLAGLIARHGAVMAGVSWFDTDVSEMESMAALRHWHRHAIVVTGVEGSKENPEFVVRDSLLTHESRYTLAELALTMPVIYTLEAGPGKGGKLEKFLGR